MAFDGRVFHGGVSGVRDIAEGIVRGLRMLENEGALQLTIFKAGRGEDPSTIGPSRFFMHGALPWVATRRNYDRIIIPRQTVPIVSKVPVAPIFHDIGFIRRPDLYARQPSVECASRRAAASSHAVAVSSFTSRELTEARLRTSTPVLSLAAIHDMGWSPSRARPYILYVAAHQPNKNIVRAITAFDIANVSDIDFVICGRGGAETDRVQLARARAVKRDRIRLVSGLSRAEYEGLFRGAHLYFQPSLYEGLGIPALDAAAAGQPVIAGRSTNLADVFRGSPTGQLFDPTSVEQMAHSLEIGVYDDAFRQASSSFNRQAVQLTDWRRVAEETLRALR